MNCFGKFRLILWSESNFHLKMKSHWEKFCRRSDWLEPVISRCQNRQDRPRQIDGFSMRSDRPRSLDGEEPVIVTRSKSSCLRGQARQYNKDLKKKIIRTPIH